MTDEKFYRLREIVDLHLLPHRMTELRRLVKSGQLKAVNIGKGTTYPRLAISSEEIARFAATLPPAQV